MTRKETPGTNVAIGRHKAVALDTNIFIYALKDGFLSRAAKELFREIALKKPQVFISVIVIEEFFVRVYKQRAEKEIPNLLNFLTNNGETIPVDTTVEIALMAAKIRASPPSLRAPDAIHLATAIQSGARLFITADRRLPKKIGKLIIKSLYQLN